MKRNAMDHALEFPEAAKAVETAFYVDCLTGSDSIEEAIDLHHQLLDLFVKGGFLLRKWNSSDPNVLCHIQPELRDIQSTHDIPNPDEYTKALGIQWNANIDHFRLTVQHTDGMTKRALFSDNAKTYDVLGWFSPSIIKAKILLQRVWESKIGWGDTLPQALHQSWLKWRSELADHHIPRCYYPRHADVASVQLHGFCDASEAAYAGVVYFRAQGKYDDVYVSLIISKTKVAPIKRLTIPCLELCGAKLLAQHSFHSNEVTPLAMLQIRLR